MNIETFNRDNWYSNQTEREYFIKDINMKVHLYNGQLMIMDLENALKIGKQVLSYSLNYNGHDTIRGIELLELFQWDIKSMFVFIDSLDHPVNKWGGYTGLDYDKFPGEPITIYKSFEKGINVFSPYALHNLKPLKENPKKWTVKHVIRALINGQYAGLRCKGVYTDDYAYDAAYNCQRGIINNAVSFAQKIIESPSGWWASANGETVSICCHSFDSNEFTFKL